MLKSFEGPFKGHDDFNLHFHSWMSDDNKGTMVVSHGQGEHSGRYDQFAEEQEKYGWNVFAWDMRGHGKSEGKRGCIDDFDDYERDLARFIELVKKKFHDPEKPLILVGHSFGGLITTRNLLLRGDQGAAAVSLSSPAWALFPDPPKWKKALANFASKWMPNVTSYNGIPDEHLTRDKEYVISLQNDPLKHKRVSPIMFKGMFDSSDEIPSQMHKIKVPILVQISDKDPVTDSAVTRELFKKISSTDKKLIEYKDSMHELFNDLNRIQVIKDQNEFLSSVV